jgi:phosphatidate cytidylyltransferase
LYAVGFVVFVVSLEAGYYKYQFEMFAWIHLTLLLVVVQSTFIVVNMFQGLVWFMLPALLIISNDTWAYVFGFFFGRTPLIALSPKKTWEGFAGAALATLITGFTLPVLLGQYPFLICPKEDLSFSSTLNCETPLPFQFQSYELPQLFQSILHKHTISLMPMQLHGIVLALFASAIAPFGGFFASGFKRAFKVKDFGESIPGHGEKQLLI